jgi:hypothetical protein
MKIREKIGQVLLNKRLSHKPPRKIAFSGVQNMHHIGILYDASEFDSYKSVSVFEKRLRQHGVKTTLLGYQHTKKLNDNYIGDMHSGFYCRRDFNWLNVCHNQFLDDFVTKDFDALFVITSQKYFPLHYASMLSSAKFKIGLAEQNSTDFDLMIEIPLNTPIQDQIKFMWDYLEMLSKPKLAEADMMA